MRDFPPTNERRSQGLLTHLRTVTTRALGGSTAKKYAPHTPPETHPVQNSPRAAGPGAHPVQNSPRTPTPAAQPVQNSPNTPKIAHFSPFCPSRENFVPHQQPNRYKTLPVQPIHRPNRYKTLPTHPASSPTGTKLSPHTQKGPFQPVLPEQGELCTASTPMPPSWENFVPLPSPRPPAGRTLYRAQRQTRYKTLPAQPVRRPNRYKTLPTRPKRPISASFARAGRTFYRTQHHDPQQGELCTAPSAKPGTKLPQHAPASSPPGTKLSQRPRSTAVPQKSSPSTPHTTTEPRKTSPSTPKNGVFRLFRACRANFFALTPSPGRAGRTYSCRGLDRTR